MLSGERPGLVILDLASQPGATVLPGATHVPQGTSDNVCNNFSESYDRAKVPLVASEYRGRTLQSCLLRKPTFNRTH